MTAMHPAENAWNQAATFLPMTGSYLDEDGDKSLPCLVVNGVQVYVYFEDGRLQISVDLDDAPAEVLEYGRVPVTFSVQGAEVWREGDVDYNTDNLKV